MVGLEISMLMLLSKDGGEDGWSRDSPSGGGLGDSSSQGGVCFPKFWPSSLIMGMGRVWCESGISRYADEAPL